MAFGLFESSRTKSEKITLFKITFGPNTEDYYAFTDGETTVEFDGIEYVPTVIKHDPISVQGTMDKTEHKIETTRSNPVTELFRKTAPLYPVTVRILVGQARDVSKDFKSIWVGRITSFTIKGNITELSTAPSGTKLKRIGLRRYYQYGCQHVLYGGSCRASKILATNDSTVLAVSGDQVTLPKTGHNFALDKYNGGFIEWQPTPGDIKRVGIIHVDDSGDDVTFTMAVVPQGMQAGMPIKLSAGCDHSMNDCKNVHNNIQNYGGFPWIPTSNPIAGKNNFY